MHRPYARQADQRLFQRRHVHTRRGAVHGQVDGILQQAPGGPQDHDHDRQADQGIDHRPAGQHDQTARRHHAQRHPGVGHHVQIGAARIQVVLRLHEQQGRAQVDDEADARHRHDDARPDRRRLVEATHGLEGDGPAGENQQQRIAQGRQNRRLAEPIGPPTARRPMRPAPRQPGRAARHGQAQHVRQIMSRIGQQRRGIRNQARAELARHEQQIDHQADSVAPVAGIHRAMAVSAMPVTVTVMTVRMAVTMIRMVVVMIVVVRVHGSPIRLLGKQPS